jgi:hypothetical protein
MLLKPSLIVIKSRTLHWGSSKMVQWCVVYTFPHCIIPSCQREDPDSFLFESRDEDPTPRPREEENLSLRDGSTASWLRVRIILSNLGAS